METYREYAKAYLREKDAGMNFFMKLAAMFFLAGLVVAIWQFYDEPGQIPVPLILAGIAWLLINLVGIAESILVALEYRILQEQERGE